MNRLSRRDFLAGAAAVAPGLATDLRRPADAKAAINTRGALTASFNFHGHATDFFVEESQAEDMGTYLGEFVQQRCLRQLHGPWSVFFRPDVGGGRHEVVVEYGQCFGEPGTVPKHIMTPFTVGILDDGRLLDTIEVPYQWWFSRWRWQSTPRPVVRSPAILKQRKWVFPFSTAAAFGAVPQAARAQRDAVARGPMGTGGLLTAMGATGDRSELGLVTEPQAEYLATESRAALAVIVDQAEACGTMPLHYRDRGTGATVDVDRHPTLTLRNGEAGLRLFEPPPPKQPDGKGGARTDPRFFEPDDAHMPPAAFVPWALTDDPYYLEELEGQATYSIIRSLYHRKLHNLPGLVYPGQTRAFAWSMRTLFQLGVAAPAKPPAWLKSQGYWRGLVTQNRRYFQKFMDDPQPPCGVFHVATVTNKISAFQDIYLNLTLAHGVALGFADWTDAMRWKALTLLNLTNGRSGWNRQCPVPYYAALSAVDPGATTVPVPPDAGGRYGYFHQWPTAWDAYAKANNFPGGGAGWDGVTYMGPNSPSYVVWLRGALAALANVGVDEARPCLAFIDAMVRKLIADKKLSAGNWKWSIAAVTT